jgi:hypothetical protein
MPTAGDDRDDARARGRGRPGWGGGVRVLLLAGAGAAAAVAVAVLARAPAFFRFTDPALLPPAYLARGAMLRGRVLAVAPGGLLAVVHEPRLRAGDAARPLWLRLFAVDAAAPAARQFLAAHVVGQRVGFAPLFLEPAAGAGAPAAQAVVARVAYRPPGLPWWRAWRPANLGRDLVVRRVAVPREAEPALLDMPLTGFGSAAGLPFFQSFASLARASVTIHSGQPCQVNATAPSRSRKSCRICRRRRRRRRNHPAAPRASGFGCSSNLFFLHNK